METRDLIHFVKRLVQKLHSIELLETNPNACKKMSDLMKELAAIIKHLEKDLK